MEEKNRIYGYKAFHEGLINQEGEKFFEGETNYKDGKGYFYDRKYLFCEKLEDALSFVDSFENEIEVAKVSSVDVTGDVLSSPFDGSLRYISSSLKIEKILLRKEIIDLMLKEGEMTKFITLYKLSDEEIEYIKSKYDGSIDFISRYIDCYQKGEKDAFVRTRKY